MNLTLNKLPWYGQLGAFVAIAFAGAFVFWQYYATPAKASIAEREAQLATVRAQADTALRNARRLPEIRREIASLEAQLDQQRQRLPEEKDVAELLRRIQAMAIESSLTIRGFTPQAVTTKQMYAEWPIGLQVEGTYNNLGAFLDRISKFRRIINVTAFNIKAKDAQTSNDTITADCTVTTFVMTEPRPVVPGAAGAAPPAAPKGE